MCWLSPVATCTGGVYHPTTGADTQLALEQFALCDGFQ